MVSIAHREGLADEGTLDGEGVGVGGVGGGVVGLGRAVQGAAVTDAAQVVCVTLDLEAKGERLTLGRDGLDEEARGLVLNEAEEVDLSLVGKVGDLDGDGVGCSTVRDEVTDVVCVEGVLRTLRLEADLDGTGESLPRAVGTVAALKGVPDVRCTETYLVVSHPVSPFLCWVTTLSCSRGRCTTRCPCRQPRTASTSRHARVRPRSPL